MSSVPTIVRGESCFCRHHRALFSLGAIRGDIVCGGGIDRTEMHEATRADRTRHLPCYVPVSCTMGHGAWNPLPCAAADYPSPEETAAAEAEDSRRHALWNRRISDCCEAPFDERGVHQSGRYKGHGPRLCSECGRVLFMV